MSTQHDGLSTGKSERPKKVVTLDLQPSTLHVSPILRVGGLTRCYGGQAVLQDIDLQLRSGEVTALLGPNGAGKTTLLRILAGLADPSAGTLEVFGKPLESIHRRSQGRPVGLVPSGDRTFYLRLSARENLLFSARMYGLRGRHAHRRCDDLLEMVGLVEAARRRVGYLSHGMQKRLAVARGLLLTPAILLVDEATHDLDPGGAEQIRKLVTSVADMGTCVLWATQRLEELPGFADNVTVLAAGRVCYSGSVDDLLERAPRRRYVLTLRQRTGTIADLQDQMGGLGTIDWIAGPPPRALIDLDVETVLGDAVARITNAGFAVVACREERSEMLDAFLHVVDESVRQ